jgi:hypothetical protein
MYTDFRWRNQEGKVLIGFIVLRLGIILVNTATNFLGYVKYFEILGGTR